MVCFHGVPVSISAFLSAGSGQVSGSALKAGPKAKKVAPVCLAPSSVSRGALRQHFQLSTAFVFLKHILAAPFVSDGWLSGAVNIHLAEEFAAPAFETATISLQSTGQAVLLNLRQIYKQALSGSWEISTFSL